MGMAKQQPVDEAIPAIHGCRSCGSERLVSVYDMGDLPPSDGFTADGRTPDNLYPQEVVFCEDCTLVQLRHTVPRELLFSDEYRYFSSFTQTVVDNARENVTEAIERFHVTADDLIVELASNDGYLLKFARDRGIPVLGIDPAKKPVEAARAAGIDTIHAFFTEELGSILASEGKRAKLLFAANVLAHVSDTAGFVRGIKHLLADDGTAIVECPYLKDLIDHREFDTIYHEHICYFSLTALDRLFRRQGLFLNDVKLIPIHGGSLRLFVQHREHQSAYLEGLLADEARLGLTKPAAFRAFADEVRGLGERLKAMLGKLKAEGKSIAGYGAAAKGTILLNHFGIGPDMIPIIADKNTHKHGLFVPGVKIPVVSPDEMLARRPDAIVILPWNHRTEIMRQLQPFKDQGGVFVIPVPEPTIV